MAPKPSSVASPGRRGRKRKSETLLQDTSIGESSSISLQQNDELNVGKRTIGEDERIIILLQNDRCTSCVSKRLEECKVVIGSSSIKCLTCIKAAKSANSCIENLSIIESKIDPNDPFLTKERRRRKKYESDNFNSIGNNLSKKNVNDSSSSAEVLQRKMDMNMVFFRLQDVLTTVKGYNNSQELQIRLKDIIETVQKHT